MIRGLCSTGDTIRSARPPCANVLSTTSPIQSALLSVGVLKDKDYKSIAATLAPLFDACVCVTPPSERALPAEELAELFKDSCREVCVAGTVEDGVDLARDIAQEQDAMVCAFGLAVYLRPDTLMLGLR